MIILIKRIVQRADFTIGCLQVIFSGKYESRHVKTSTLKAHPSGGLWMTLCDTVEPVCIPWQNRPQDSQRIPDTLPRGVAIPEGRYPIALTESSRHQGKVATLWAIPQLKKAAIRNGVPDEKHRSDIRIGHLIAPRGGHKCDRDCLGKGLKVRKLLIALIEEAQSHGEQVWVTVHSPKHWRWSEEGRETSINR